ncbi:hypothetical protein pb186bvf_016135 [Paramecium bursaria]
MILQILQSQTKLSYYQNQACDFYFATKRKNIQNFILNLIMSYHEVLYLFQMQQQIYGSFEFFKQTLHSSYIMSFHLMIDEQLFILEGFHTKLALKCDFLQILFD